MTYRRLVLAGSFLLMAGCATPEGIKEASRRQGELLAEFQTTLGTLRAKLLEYYDAQTDEFRQHLIEAKMRAESPWVMAALEGAMQAPSPGLPEGEKHALIRRQLNQASNYLIQLRRIYFGENYCEELRALRPDFFRPAGEPCDDRHVQVFKRLREGREQVAERFDRLATSVARMDEAHALIHRFLQIEFRLTRERVDAAKKVIDEAKQTVEAAKDVFERVRRATP